MNRSIKNSGILKYKRPVISLFVINIENSIASSSKVDVEFGNSNDGHPIIEDPTVEKRDVDIFFN
ncbi:hypothetical protein [Sphingobacterium bovistauri]|uniref:Uncharacterized protein n=1 Tax=Sphingobacterium bovistauri TaxID=2781959 RepID=A0ABS7Z6B8_9SPHI|nr:hypothetical protein [Sphingobacterium bovistauri]MCA5004946.1 hypothetical protein [Sphingobacterium bovistauri]